MAHRTRFLRATALAGPLGALALSAQAADIASTIQEQPQFSTLAEAIEAAGITESLQGEGPYTVFAPTDQAFEQLPEGVLDELMKQENQGQLRSLLQYHVVEGNEIAAKDAAGQQMDVATMSGDRLSVDGTGQIVMLVPIGLTVTRIGDEVYVERDVAAVTAPTVEIAPAGGGQQTRQPAPGQTEQQQAQTEQGSDMPSSPHQEQLLRGEQGGEQQGGQQVGTQQPQTAGAQDVPSSPHQEQLLRGEQGTQQQTAGQLGGQQPSTEQDADMPSSPHQEQTLRGEQGGEQQGGQQLSTQRPQTAEADDMPSSPHQEQLLREQQGSEQQTARESTIPVSPEQLPQTGETGGQPTVARSDAGQDADMPSSPHQEQTLRGEQSGEQQGSQQLSTQQPQTAEADDMPSSPHQEQLLREQQGSEQQTARESTIPVSPEQLPQTGETGGQPTVARSDAGQDADMPSSPHQEQTLRGEQSGEQQGSQQLSTQQPQTAEADDMPSSPHQEQLLREQQGSEQQTARESTIPVSPEQLPQTGETGGQPTVARSETGQDAGVPSSPHQEQLLRGQQGGEQQTGQQLSTQQPQTSEADDMPSSPHQEQLLRGQQGTEQASRQSQGILREATVVEPDIQADNGVIHAVDALLVPPAVLQALEESGGSSADEQSYQRPTPEKRG